MNGEPREYYENHLHGQLSELAGAIEELEARLDEAGWEPQSDYDLLVSDLRLRLRQTGGLVEALESGSDAAWFNRVREAEDSLRRIADVQKTLSGTIDDFLPD
jgi:hypothetical protein